MVKGGKKYPAGRIFIGGSPWFNERTGQRRSAEEVYKMLYGKVGGGERSRFDPSLFVLVAKLILFIGELHPESKPRI